MTVCQSPSGSSRRYDYIHYENGRNLGESNQCERGTTNRVESWHRWIVHKCSYCFCLCDEQGPKSDRYFNLRQTVADVEENKVVTGLRFVKKNRIFHLQIQQGKLLPHGVIDIKTVEWKPVDDYEIDGKNIVNGVDYHALHYYNRSLDLDNVMSQNDNSSVVTGIRFRVLGSHLNLMAQLSKFDFESGRLLQPKVNSIWQSNDGQNREKINLDTVVAAAVAVVVAASKFGDVICSHTHTHSLTHSHTLTVCVSNANQLKLSSLARVNQKLTAANVNPLKGCCCCYCCKQQTDKWILSFYLFICHCCCRTHGAKLLAYLHKSADF